MREKAERGFDVSSRIGEREDLEKRREVRVMKRKLLLCLRLECMEWLFDQVQDA
jgi:hypothetical protein